MDIQELFSYKMSDDEKENIVRIIEKVRKEHESNNLYLR